ncbi:HAD family phosphatase [Bdellovibrio sp. NC01]|uniref:HAD family hydrolase n=1 Tax=Bdellovibrio sp. NC01 TaxID=2220073 RepID=UPI00115A01EE|nr:HAD-IA family hydrolase [Bdellovibrio sp. NC01]QDK38052.1 HAD family phosphatase [Bdellovibrio sp. NC01]
MLKRFYPSRDYEALLFDFDGTVADTMGTHLEAWNLGLAAYDLSLSKEQHQTWAGIPTVKIVELLNQKHGTQISAENFLKEKEVHYLASLGTVKSIVPVMEIIQHYHGKLPMAIVTGSRRKIVELTMDHLGIGKYFDLLVCAEDYVNGKPAPDCFLKAAASFNIKPQHCLAFEDADLGIQSAHSAGMDCLKVTADMQLLSLPVSR